MNAIQSISGQEYVDMYASEAKAQLLKQAREEKAEDESTDEDE